MIKLSELKRWTPTRTTSGNTINEIRVSLRPRDNFINLSLFIGKNILQKIGVDITNRVDVFFKEDERKLAYIVKNKTGLGGYSFSETESKKGVKADYYRILFKCWLSPEEVSKEESRSHPVDYKIEDNILVIDLSAEKI